MCRFLGGRKFSTILVKTIFLIIKIIRTNLLYWVVESIAWIYTRLRAQLRAWPVIRGEEMLV